MKVFIMSIIGQILMSAYLVYKLRQTKAKETKWGRLLQWMVIIYLFSFLLVYTLRPYLTFREMEQCLRFYNNTYVAALIYCFGLLLVGALTRLFIWFKKRKGIPTAPEDARRWYAYVMLTGLLFLVLICNKGYHNTMEPIVSRYQVKIDKSASVPALKIAFISDPHIGEIMGLEQMNHLADMVQQEKPDLILIGGDILDYSAEYTHDEAITTAMKRLQAPLGTYYVLGNHEYRGDTLQKIHWIASIGTLLRDSVLTLPGTDIQLIGRDDATNRQRADLKSLAQQFNIDPAKPILLFDHQPLLRGEEEEAGVDLGMYGHTHNGQFVPFKWLLKLVFKLTHGMEQHDRFTYVVSSGYGVAGSPFRVGTHSEITIIDLRFH